MRRSESTRRHIIQNAAGLFNQKGFVGASVADIMTATGLQKGGIYRHFESKEALALEAFDYAAAVMGRRFRAAVSEADSAVDQLRQVIHVFQSLAMDPPVAGGCPIINTAVDADDGNEALRLRARRAMDWLRRLLRTTIEHGKALGELRQEVDADGVASIIISAMEGGVVLSRLYDDPAHVDRVSTHLMDWIRRDLCP